MEASACSTLLIFLGPGLGIRMSSLATPRLYLLCSLSSWSSRYRTCFAREPRRGLELPKTSSSRESRSLICRGSSSPICSARSPVSLHEKSESDGDRESEERRPGGFSCTCSPWGWWLLEAALVRVRRGMFAGRRMVFGDGIVAAGGLYGSSPVCPWRRDGNVGESGERRGLSWRV